MGTAIVVLVIVATTLSPDAMSALLGAGGGWLLALVSGLLIEARRRKRRRRTAALLVFEELTDNSGAVGAIRVYGGPMDPVRRSRWEAHAGELLDGASLGLVGSISMAYSTLEDIATVSSMRPDFGSDSDFEWLDGQLPFVRAGLKEVGMLTGLTEAEMESRLAGTEAHTEARLEAMGEAEQKESREA